MEDLLVVSSSATTHLEVSPATVLLVSEELKGPAQTVKVILCLLTHCTMLLVC